MDADRYSYEPRTRRRISTIPLGQAPMYGELSAPTLVVHPSRKCSYTCVHCYSSGSPAASAGLPSARVVDLVGAAAQAGFTRLVLSGGEPLAWEGLEDVLSVARMYNMERIVEASGAGLTEARASGLATLVDRFCIGIDGRATRHDVVHGRGGAFAAAERAIAAARNANIPVGINHALRLSSLPDLDWLADWCVEAGASALRIRPMLAAGRAALSWIADDALGPSAIASARSRITEVATRLRGRLIVRLEDDDAEVARLLAQRLRTAHRRETLAQVLPQLVLEEDGTLVPLRYGIPREYALGNVLDRALPTLVPSWHAGPAIALSQALDRSHAAKSDRGWFDLGVALRATAA